MSFSRNAPAGMVSKGFQKITLNSTAASLNTTCITGTTILLSVETQSVRVTMDGSTTPAASTGVLLIPANSPYWLEGIDGSKLQIARVTAGAIVQVQSFKRVGEQ
jgi:hypothetical protein